MPFFDDCELRKFDDCKLLLTVLDRNDTELLTGQTDKHLDFKLSVISYKENEYKIVELATTVKFHNLLGKTYFFFVKPFHRYFMKRILKRMNEELIKIQVMKWYDIFSNIYDSSLEKLYFESRKRAVELLDLKNGQTLIDIACGTGANFKHIKALNIDLDIYGTDFSEGMLKKGQATIDKNNWNNITLFRADARELTLNSIREQINQDLSIDRIICVLGLSVIPEWEQVLDKMLDLLEDNGRIVIVDVFAEKRGFNTWLVEKFAQADLNRKIWQTLEKKTSNFHYEYLPVKESKVGGKLFVATGVKKTANKV